uniref:Uncharacterized protein n=1 Tax=Acrobeloides nanus TaxID=290746 RepID=A0A914CJW4_9BILA
MKFFIFLLGFLIFNNVEAYKILVAYEHDSKSHLGSMIPLVKSLSQNNNVTFFYIAKRDLPPNLGPNISYIQTNINMRDEGRRDFLTLLQFRKTMHSFDIYPVFIAGDIILGHMIEYHMEKILEVLNQEWDLVILDELFGMHAHTFAIILNRLKKVPYIVFSTTLMVETTSSNMALSRPIL